MRLVSTLILLVCGCAVSGEAPVSSTEGAKSESEGGQARSCALGDSAVRFTDLAPNSYRLTGQKTIDAAHPPDETESRQILRGLQAVGVSDWPGALSYADDGQLVVVTVTVDGDYDAFTVYRYRHRGMLQGFIFTLESLELVARLSDREVAQCTLPGFVAGTQTPCVFGATVSQSCVSNADIAKVHIRKWDTDIVFADQHGNEIAPTYPLDDRLLRLLAEGVAFAGVESIDFSLEASYWYDPQADVDVLNEAFLAIDEVVFPAAGTMPCVDAPSDQPDPCWAHNTVLRCIEGECQPACGSMYRQQLQDTIAAHDWQARGFKVFCFDDQAEGWGAAISPQSGKIERYSYFD